MGALSQLVLPQTKEAEHPSPSMEPLGEAGLPSGRGARGQVPNIKSLGVQGDRSMVKFVDRGLGTNFPTSTRNKSSRILLGHKGDLESEGLSLLKEDELRADFPLAPTHSPYIAHPAARARNLEFTVFLCFPQFSSLPMFHPSPHLLT